MAFSSDSSVNAITALSSRGSVDQALPTGTAV